MVHSIMDNGDLRVSYGQNNWIINPSAVVKVSNAKHTVLSIEFILLDMLVSVLLLVLMIGVFACVWSSRTSQTTSVVM